MPLRDVTARTLRSLGPVGVFLGVNEGSPPADQQRNGVQRVEAAGYRAVWTNEVVGADAMVRAALWLAATRELVIGTCIANMWARPAQTAHAAARQLAEAFPDRFVLGLGVGRPEQAVSVGRDFGSPLATARAYLEPVVDPAYPRILGANGPGMLALAAELTDGALPAGMPPDATAGARTAVGADALLVVYVPTSPTDEPAEVSSVVRGHLDAGADHVVVGMPYDTDFTVAVDRLELLAPTLTTIAG